MRKAVLSVLLVSVLIFAAASMEYAQSAECPVDCGGGHCCRAGEKCCPLGCCPADMECCMKDGKQRCCPSHKCTIADRDRKEAQCNVDRGCGTDLVCQSNCLNYANGWWNNGCK